MPDITTIANLITAVLNLATAVLLIKLATKNKGD